MDETYFHIQNIDVIVNCTTFNGIEFTKKKMTVYLLFYSSQGIDSNSLKIKEWIGYGWLIVSRLPFLMSLDFDVRKTKKARWRAEKVSNKS